MKTDEFFNEVRAAIDEQFHCVAQGGVLVHQEQHHDGTESSFSIRASCKLVAFSLDKRGLNPFPILSTSVKKLTAKNDLTIICESRGQVYVFVSNYSALGIVVPAQAGIQRQRGV